MPVDQTSPATSIGQNLMAYNQFNPAEENSLLANVPATSNSGEPVSISANEFRLLKLPTFWHKQPKLWFAQLECEFQVYRIRSDELKFNTVVRHLDEQALIAVAELIENPPATDRYELLKKALISRFSDSQEKRLRQLLAGIELNDKKPSDLLRELKQLAEGAISDNVLHSIWLQRLPFRVQSTLAVVEESPLNKLAELADKIMEREPGSQINSVLTPESSSSQILNFNELERRIAALELKRSHRSRSKSKSRSKGFRSYSKNKENKSDKTDNDDSQVCYYHKRFGTKAVKCTIPCSMSKLLTDKQEN